MQYYLWATRTSADVSVPRLTYLLTAPACRVSQGTVPAFSPLALMRDLLAVRRVSRPREQHSPQTAAFCFRCPILLRTMREVCATTTAST